VRSCFEPIQRSTWARAASGSASISSGCRAPRRLDEGGIALEVREAQERQPALALAEVFAGAAQLEVAARDPKPSVFS